MRKLTICLTLTLLMIFTYAGLNPSAEYERTPDMFGMSYEKVKIKTNDDFKLHGWFFKPTNTKKDRCVIISGDGKGNMADELAIAGQFMSLGYHVLTYDYRGYGKSAEFDINKKLFTYPQFRKDLLAAVDYVGKYHPTLGVDLYGIGIGAALSIGVGVHKEEVERVIADSPYPTFSQVKKRYEDAGESITMPLAYDKYYWEPKYALEEKGKFVKGVLFIVGEKGKYMTPEDVKGLSEIQKRLSYYYEVKGAKNSETFTKDKNKYFEEIKEFLKETD